MAATVARTGRHHVTKQLRAPILLPLLLTLSAGKFALVVMFFMHLRYDPRSLSAVFVGPLIIATLLGLALIALVGTLLTLHR